MTTRNTIASILTTTAIAFSIAPPAYASSIAAAAQATTPIAGDDRDRGLQQQIRKALGRDAILQGSHIAVSARAGAVTLAGVVRSEAQKLRAQTAVQRLNGVTFVKNALEVAADGAGIG